MTTGPAADSGNAARLPNAQTPAPRTDADTRSARKAALKELAVVLAVCAAIKAVFLFFDHALFLFSDSSTYTTLAQYLREVDPYRPPGYAWIIRLIWVVTGDTGLQPIVYVQAVFGALTALVAYAFCKFNLRSPAWISWLAAITVAASPFNLQLERMLVAEGIGLFALAASVFFLVWTAQRQSLWSAVVLGVCIAATVLFRGIWSYLGYIAPALIIIAGIFGAGPSKRRAIACAAIALISYLVPYQAYCCHFSYRMFGTYFAKPLRATTAQGVVFWGRAIPLLQKGDLREFPWGKRLEQLTLPYKHKDYVWQFWSNDAAMPTPKFMAERGLLLQDADELLRNAARAVITRHKAEFMQLVIDSALKAVKPSVRNQVVSIKKKAEFEIHLRKFRHAGIDTDGLEWPEGAPPEQPTIFHKAMNAWLYLKPVALVLACLGGVLALLRPGRRFPLLVLTALSTSHVLLLVITLADPLERYYQPVEFLSVLTAATLLTMLLAKRGAHNRQSQESGA